MKSSRFYDNTYYEGQPVIPFITKMSLAIFPRYVCPVFFSYKVLSPENYQQLKQNLEIKFRKNLIEPLSDLSDPFQFDEKSDVSPEATEMSG